MSDTNYALLDSQLRQAFGEERNALATAANFVAVLYHALDDVNWLGLYILRGDGLVLGPFQGLAAVPRIEMGKGVCGTAAATRTTQRVPDVHAFPGHIACDIASRSELVVPLTSEAGLVGVLDIDSPLLDRFSAEDQAGVESLCNTFLEALAESDTSI
ncbi:MAG: GAF domain-containing protein [Pseudomonadota bacterium]